MQEDIFNISLLVCFFAFVLSVSPSGFSFSLFLYNKNRILFQNKTGKTCIQMSKPIHERIFPEDANRPPPPMHSRNVPLPNKTKIMGDFYVMYVYLTKNVPSYWNTLTIYVQQFFKLLLSFSFQNLFTCTHVFQKYCQCLEYLKEMYWTGKGDVILRKCFYIFFTFFFYLFIFFILFS